MDPIWISVLIGAGIGIIVSVIFGIYSKSTTTAYTRSIFGVSSSELIANITVAVLVTTMVILSVMSAFVRDLDYPRANPVKFTIETLLMALPPALTFVLVMQFRGVKFTGTTIGEIAALAAKFGALHVLLQFSGFYSYAFS